MKNIQYFIVVINLGLLMFFSSCNQKANHQAKTTNNLLQDIEALNQKLMNSRSATPDTALANSYVAKCLEFAQKLPQDTMASDFLFKAGDVMRGLKQYDQSFATFERIEKDYSGTKRAADALFMRAFIYENELQDKVKATSLYQQFLEKYPNHELRGQIETILSQINKTPEQLIQEFEMKNKK